MALHGFASAMTQRLFFWSLLPQKRPSKTHARAHTHTHTAFCEYGTKTVVFILGAPLKPRIRGSPQKMEMITHSLQVDGHNFTLFTLACSFVSNFPSKWGFGCLVKSKLPKRIPPKQTHLEGAWIFFTCWLVCDPLCCRPISAHLPSMSPKAGPHHKTDTQNQGLLQFGILLDFHAFPESPILRDHPSVGVRISGLLERNGKLLRVELLVLLLPHRHHLRAGKGAGALHLA